MQYLRAKKLEEGGLLLNRLRDKLLSNFSATFEIFGYFLEFWQLWAFQGSLKPLSSRFERHWSVIDIYSIYSKIQ